MRLSGRYWIGLLAAAVAISVLPAAPAAAADEGPGKLTDTWVFWVKPGHEAAFETAVKAHVAWRKTAGEPFQWNAYQPVVGDDISHFVFRSGPHHWKDFDDQQVWGMKTNASQKFQEQVAPHVDRYAHSIDELDTDNSMWTDSPDYRYFGVSRMSVKPGTAGKRNAALSTIHAIAQAQKWPHSFAILHPIGGEARITFAFPFKSYADMADPDPSFFSVMAKALGSEGTAGAVFESFGSTIESQTYTIYATRPDLSTPK